jgi:hypothetical protein
MLVTMVGASDFDLCGWVWFTACGCDFVATDGATVMDEWGCDSIVGGFDLWGWVWSKAWGCDFVTAPVVGDIVTGPIVTVPIVFLTAQSFQPTFTCKSACIPV